MTLEELRRKINDLPVMAPDRTPEQQRLHAAWVDAECKHAKEQLAKLGPPRWLWEMPYEPWEGPCPDPTT